MSKTYVFAIGGTGARVLKSLSFLLASGMKCNTSKIVPIIIDPDKGNADKNRTIDIMRIYQKVRSHLAFDNEIKNQFFRTEIDSLTGNFSIHIQGSNDSFKNFIDYGNLSKASQSLMSLLYSEGNLQADMQVGFKGNPNMGSVVLNQFQESEDYQNFAASFQQEDKIFIISSIFGGTGAAGFPLLLKNLRQPSNHITNNNLIQSAKIGAISVLPYFGVKNDADATVDRRTFMSKTRAALSYYKTNLNNQLDSLYYIGDQIINQYENNEGSVQQRNDAHLVELISALAVIDFANSQPKTDNSINLEVKEFGIQNPTQEVTFNDLYDSTKNRLFPSLSQFYLMHLYIHNKLGEDLNKNSLAKYANDFKINTTFLETPFYQEFTRFMSWFYEWLQELDRNQRSFSPFELQERTNVYFDKIKGMTLKKGNAFSGGSHFHRYTNFLNKAAKDGKVSSRNKATQFMEVNFLSTQQLIK